VLMRDTLAWFKIRQTSLLHSAAKKKIHLGNAYVLSGFLAAQLLPPEQFAETAARRYQDGLEADDEDVDRLFIVLHYKHKFGAGGQVLPSLKKKRKMSVFMTRSKLERDSWCWALNSEIERVTRSQKEYEERIRDQGTIAQL
jgi:hypothetical protein